MPKSLGHSLIALFHEHKVNRQNQADKCCQVVPMQSLSLEEKRGKDCKYNQGNDLLNDLQLHECEWTAIVNETNAISRNLE